MNLDFIAKPFGILMQLIYNTLAFENYGMAIIIFTIFVRILLFPLNLKQQKSILRTQELQPEIEALKRNYGNDKEKFQQEQMKLYQKYNINPMAGCFPALIQLPLIFTIYKIVQKPLTFIMGKADVIGKLTDYVAKALNVSTKSLNEIKINNYFVEHSDKLKDVAKLISKDDIINMSFLKIFNLGLTPSISFNKISGNPGVYLPLLLIPIFSSLTTYIMQKMSTGPVKKDNNPGKKNTENEPQTPNALNTMTKVMPIITLVFTFSVPAGLGLYWIIGNILGIGQNYVTKKVFQKKKEGNE